MSVILTLWLALLHALVGAVVPHDGVAVVRAPHSRAEAYAGTGTRAVTPGVVGGVVGGGVRVIVRGDARVATPGTILRNPAGIDREARASAADVGPADAWHGARTRAVQARAAEGRAAEVARPASAEYGPTLTDEATTPAALLHGSPIGRLTRLARVDGGVTPPATPAPSLPQVTPDAELARAARARTLEERHVVAARGALLPYDPTGPPLQG